MKHRNAIGWSSSVGWMLLLVLTTIPQMAKATTWNATVGAESKDQAAQADAFLPNELWIQKGDSIKWTFAPQNEIHTVALLKPGQNRPVFQGGPPPVGCAGITGETATQASPVSYDGAGVSPSLACVNSGPLAGGATYTVTFPKSGNYKLVCLVHTNMNGTVHVLDQGPLPYLQYDYDRQGRDEAHDLLKDADNPREELRDFPRAAHEVIMTGEIAATGGGRQYLSIVRFLPGTIHVHTGDTVEWTNLDPNEPHTVTFDIEPLVPTTLVGVGPTPFTGAADIAGGVDADGAWHGVIPNSIKTASPPGVLVAPGPPPVFACFTVACTNTLNSGFLQASPEDAVGVAQAPVGTTRLRITFTQPGTYNYICALHDVDGMLGTVIVDGPGGKKDGDNDKDDK